MKKTLVLLILIFVGFACDDKKNSGIRLVIKGESAYTIVIPNGASTAEVRAAIFFKDHIKKISGCEIPLVHSDEPISDYCIVISKSNEIKEADGFEIKAEDRSLYIYGGHNKGCIYGVSEILEKYLGIRYYSPQFVFIPQSKDITLPMLQISDAPVNSFRCVNGDFIKDQNYKDFHRLNETSDVFAEGYYVHTFHKLLPWQDYFKNHPEFFAFMNGKRIIDQLCLSNPDVLEIVIKKLGEEMKRQPDKQLWSVSQDDNFSYCQCDQCKKTIEEEGSPAGPLIRFVNKVAEAFPDKTISTLAYQYSRQAPLLTKPLDNVQIMLCTIELNRSKPITKDPLGKQFVKDLEDWGKITNHIYLWDYTVNFSHSISPFPNIHVLQPNLKLFADNNVREHFQQSNTGIAHEFSELKSYLLAKLLWNPEVDVTSVINEFADGYYGPASPFIRKYIYSLKNNIQKSDEWLDIYGHPTAYQNSFLSAENIAVYNSYFDEAEKASSLLPEYLLHVKTARMPLQYAIMEIGKNDMFGERGWYKEENGEFVPRQEMIDMLEAFYKTSMDCNASFINESGLSCKDYYLATKRFIDVQVKGNLAFRKTVSAKPLPSEKYSEGKLSYLTNGVRGANDYKVHWLGWEGMNFSLSLDLEMLSSAKEIQISTLWDPKSWILHPKAVSCSVSKDGFFFSKLETQVVSGNQKNENVNHTFAFKTQGQEFRYVKFDIEGTQKLYDWHPSAGGASWVFVDEIVVK